MLENVVEKSFSVSPLVGFLVVAIIGLGLALIHIYKKTDEKLDAKDNLNREFTNGLVADLKDDIKELKKENKADRETLRTALDTFNRTTKEFQSINSTLSEIKTDITVIKEKIK